MASANQMYYFDANPLYASDSATLSLVTLTLPRLPVMPSTGKKLLGETFVWTMLLLALTTITAKVDLVAEEAVADSVRPEAVADSVRPEAVADSVEIVVVEAAVEVEVDLVLPVVAVVDSVDALRSLPHQEPRPRSKLVGPFDALLCNIRSPLLKANLSSFFTITSHSKTLYHSSSQPLRVGDLCKVAMIFIFVVFAQKTRTIKTRITSH
jgi:hypothetical protein